MTLEEKLIQRLFDQYGQKGQNVQGVLDNSFFQALPLSKKIELIEKHRGDLSRVPGFNWSSVGKGAITGGLAATSAVLLRQVMNNATAAGFKPNLVGLGIAGALGTAVGATVQYRASKDEYNRDVKTKQSIDDAINVLIHRSMSRAPQRPDMLADLRSRIRRIPEEVGNVASTMDWSVPNQ